MEKNNGIITSVLILLFPFVLLGYELRLFKLVFLVIVFQMFMIAFISNERTRLLIWCVNAFSFSILIILYGYRLIEGLPFPLHFIILMGVGLQLVPILLLLYIYKMFNKRSTIGFTCGQSESHLSFWIILVCLLTLSLFLIGYDLGSLHSLPWVILYCILHAFLYEILWRGLLLELVVSFLGVYKGIFLIGLSFGIYLLIMGNSMVVSMFMTFLSLWFSKVKLKTQSIFPPILLHYITMMILNFTGQLFIPL